MRAALATLVLVCIASHAEAHGMRTAYLEVDEVAPGRALVRLRVTAIDAVLAVTSPDCSLAIADGDSVEDRRWLLDCAGTLEGHTLEFVGLGPIVSEAVASITFADGDSATHLVRAATPTFALRAEPPSTIAVAREFVGLGLLHIATGYDHFLFLLLLVLLLRDVRNVMLAETAFTLSHSLAFSATALGWLRVSSSAAEACIALSLLLLAADIGSHGAGLRWRGAAMALVFGFVHGLGFAGGLRELGLPEHAIGTALVGFAAGIELGQLAFLVIVLVTSHVLRKLTLLPSVQLAIVSAIGGLSAYWFLERTLLCF